MYPQVAFLVAGLVILADWLASQEYHWKPWPRARGYCGRSFRAGFDCHARAGRRGGPGVGDPGPYCRP
ncbi:HD domain-containing protein [Streptomyces sp. NPDC087420]|uniref:HD domain-containing protein n=1 Tax=Streptomyces sp. NPDC087420 TaxID=3365785 RepID=UPI003832C08F